MQYAGLFDLGDNGHMHTERPLERIQPCYNQLHPTATHGSLTAAGVAELWYLADQVTGGLDGSLGNFLGPPTVSQPPVSATAAVPEGPAPPAGLGLSFFFLRSGGGLTTWSNDSSSRTGI